MPAPFPIADQRMFVDYLNNANEQPPGPAPSALKGAQSGIAAASAAISNTETIFLQTQVVPGTAPLGTLQVGSELRYFVSGTSTATVANTTTFNLYIGTAGTTADAKVVTFTTAASGTTGTNIVFLLTGTVTVRTVGTAATAFYTFRLENAAATGLAGGVGPFYFTGTQNATFNTQTGVFVSLSVVNAAATTAETIQQAMVEVLP